MDHNFESRKSNAFESQVNKVLIVKSAIDYADQFSVSTQNLNQFRNSQFRYPSLNSNMITQSLQS